MPEEKDEKKPKETIIREIHKPVGMQGRTFHIESRHAKVILATNYPTDSFPKMAAIGVNLFDHVSGAKNILEKEQDEQDHI